MVKLIIHGILENHNRSFMKISKNLGQYDLVSKISKYLDPHMTINILDFLSEVVCYIRQCRAWAR